MANTKTASTSIEYTLSHHAEIMRAGGSQQKHMPLKRVRQDYWFLFDRPAHRFDSYFRFGVIRDPVDWILSWYRYRKGNKVESPLPAGMTFADFWAARDWNVMRNPTTPYLQSDLFFGDKGGLLADVIIPYERLDEMFGEICKGLGVSGPLQVHNASRIRTVDEDIPAAVMDEMRAHYAPDYALIARLDEINAVGMKKLADLPKGAAAAKGPGAKPPAGGQPKAAGQPRTKDKPEEAPKGRSNGQASGARIGPGGGKGVRKS